MRVPKFQITGSSVVNVLGAFAVLYLVVVLGQTIHRNYELGHQIDTLNQQIGLLKDQKQELAYDIQYYQTNSYKDREARSQLGLQLPGENVVIIPKDSPAPQPSADVTPAKSSGPKSNFQQWIDFWAGRSST
ncbi:MAG TPA: septum formation initiator family protein [Candidatus Saccharimonadia bacterium]|jgi:cell division protein FtsB